MSTVLSDSCVVEILPRVEPPKISERFAYVWKGHPLASKSELSLDELREYPCVSFDQSSESEFYLTEEALGNYEFEN